MKPSNKKCWSILGICISYPISTLPHCHDFFTAPENKQDSETYKSIANIPPFTMAQFATTPRVRKGDYLDEYKGVIVQLKSSLSHDKSCNIATAFWVGDL